jgi:hypothetical protein
MCRLAIPQRNDIRMRERSATLSSNRGRQQRDSAVRVAAARAHPRYRISVDVDGVGFADAVKQPVMALQALLTKGPESRCLRWFCDRAFNINSGGGNHGDVGTFLFEIAAN